MFAPTALIAVTAAVAAPESHPGRSIYRRGLQPLAETTLSEAAPHVHALLTSTDLRVKNELTRKSDADLAAELLELDRKLAVGVRLFGVSGYETAELD